MGLHKSALRFHGIFGLLFLLLPSVGFAQHYIQTNLVSSIPGVGTNPTNPLDMDLKNAWGLTRGPATPWWVADNGTGRSTLYNGVGNKNALVVTIPVPMGHTGSSAPTGVVFNGTSDFALPGSTAARFIFVTEEGTIAGWNGGNTAVIVMDNSPHEAIYKGVTIGELNGKHYLYVANFHSGEIEVYDAAFQRVRLQGNSFVNDDDDKNDRSFNGNPHNFAPFNVQAKSPARG
jgi:uncharacterized protein (TIGR03118 family)